MTIGESESDLMNIRPLQDAMRAQCFYPSEAFVEFPIVDVEMSIPMRFEKMVSMFPERLAVKTQDRPLTYHELNRTANSITHAVSEHSESIEEPIALVLEQGSDIVAAILGVLKAGKVYVPLDPAFPQLRNQEILQDSTACRIVTNNRNLTLAKELASNGIVVINIDDLPVSLEIATPPSRAAADTLANILYTSGSTGKPKGVVQNHRNILHLIMRYTNRARITPEDRIALLRSFNVHQGTLMTFAALLNGAAVLPFDTKREGLGELARWLAREEITIARMGPTLLRHLTASLRGEDIYPKLREISFSGEPLCWRDVERVRKHIPSNCALVNSFGSTEVSSCCEYIIAREPAIESGVVPCGYPTSAMEILLLQDDGSEAQSGEIGEIAVRSHYLALEYWRNPDLTDMKFLPSDSGKGERIYRTGDQGRLSPDGRLEHLGRKDFQVKIRGYRVELSEIESALLALDNVKDAVVVGHADPAGEKCLVAYVVPQRSPAPTTTLLRRALQDSLPDYMSPAAFVVLDALPLTPNGKVDRNALPAPTDARPEIDTAYVAPRNRLESEIGAIWAEVLMLEKVDIGVDDNFFDWRGHSLSAARIISRVWAQYGVELPLAEFFARPTVAQLASYVAVANRTISDEARIHPAAGDRYRPASFSQESLWFISQLQPDCAAYNEPKALRLRGRLDIDALTDALNAVLTRHQVLRSNFSLVDGRLVSIVSPVKPLPIELVDISSQPDDQKEHELHRLLKGATIRPFDLGRDLLLRATLFRTRAEEHVLLLVVHHIATDGWSSTILFREISLLYQAAVTGNASPLPNLAFQYGDFASWQRRVLVDNVLASKSAYWRKQLADAPNTLDLPADRPRPAVQTFHGKSRTFTLPNGLAQRLRDFCRGEEATLFMALLAGFHVLLQRYTGQPDILIGVPVANRPHSELENVIGFFINTVVLRTDGSNDPTYRELVGRIKNTCLQAFANQDVPFEKVVEELQPQRSQRHGPLVQVMFQLRNVPARTIGLPGIDVEEIIFEKGYAKFDLSLSMTEIGDSLTGNLEYSSDLFDEKSMRCFLQQYSWLLEQSVSEPDKAIRSYSLVTPESRLLLPDPTLEILEPRQPLVIDHFARWAALCPYRCALRQGQKEWTYSELAQSSRSLAHMLLALGLTAGDVVAVHGSRSFGVIASMLATLSSRGVLLTIDRSLPVERKRVMLAESSAKYLLSVSDEAEQESWWEGDFSPLPVLVDAHRGRAVAIAETVAETAALPELTPEDPAYIFFTSGTTGTPKAILGVHKGLAHFLAWQRSEFAISADDRVAQLTNMSFDPVLREVFLPLTSGATLCLPDPAEDFGAESVIGWLGQERISVLHAVPSLAQQWLADQKTFLPDLRLVFSMGEPLTDTLARRWRVVSLDRAQVINFYGPTETTLVKCFYRVPPNMRPGVQPAGVPLPETQALVLGSHNQMCGINEPGEIVLRTPYRTLGYINAPEENQRRFVANPFRRDVRDLIYFTGDLGRYTSNGVLEILGRTDDQVKIRGVRIEPAEVAAVLERHAAVASCFVTARKNKTGENALVAFVVAADSRATATELRSYLMKQLPAALVPASFVFLNALPLLPNGKVDRRALPDPGPQREAAFTAPRNTREAELALIWRDVLKTERVGVHDDFFVLGGHSLLATQVVSRVNHSFQIDLPLRRLFETPTIAGLADSIHTSMAIEHHSQLLQPIVPVPRSDDTQLSFAQERLWFLHRLDPDSPTYNVPAAFRLAGDLNVKALEQSLNEVVRRHEVLRTVFAAIDGTPVQKILPSLIIALTPIDLGNLPESAREPAIHSLIKQEALRPFDLSRGPLIRARLLRLSPLNHVLALNLHHIVSDGWSMGVLFREISTLYQAFSSGKPSPQIDLPVQYADYSTWQRRWLQGVNLDKQLAYWRKQLDSLPTLHLPTDHPRPTMQTYRGSSRSAELPAQLSQALKDLSQSEGVTLFMTLLAAFQILLCRYCGQDDIAVGTPIAGRTRQEIERLIGFFVNTLVLRADLSHNPTFMELLRLVRETTLEAYTHQDLPFEKLVEELHPERNPNISPLFQAMFVLQNNAAIPLDLGQVTVAPIRMGSHVAKFDLTLSMSERQGVLHASLNYNSDLFDAATIERMLGHYQTLLEGIVGNPGQSISELPLLTEPEKHQLLVEWNNTNTEYPKTKCVHELFEEQVEKTPDAIALVFEDRQFTYRELNQRTNQLAHYLRQQEVQPDTLVALCMERSVEMVIAILGVLKAGGAYVPMEPELPAERRHLLLNDTQARLILTQDKFRLWFTEFTGQIFYLDSESHRLLDRSDENPQHQVLGHHAAYVIYTSGSTGNPKGVINVHSGLLNRLLSMQETFCLTADDRVLQKTPFTFDVSVWEFLWPLISGACLVMARPGGHREGAYLVDLIKAQQITTLHFVPSMLEVFLQEPDVDCCTSLRLVFCGGEALSYELQQRFFERSLASLHNLYGPTEASIEVTAWECRNNGDLTIVPIGRPIANTQIYILDPHLNPVAIGVAGELHIGGIGLARGYLNRPELTAEKFIANPFSKEPGARIYKTGDLARYLPDGNIEFLGRIDSQVKIRGLRVELGEIDAVLGQHPAVKQAVVLAREDTPGDKRLAAYTVTASGAAISANDLRSFLQQKLPDYMLPSAYVFLDSLPLTPNGKLDRKALPAPDHRRPELDHAFAAPRTPIEEILANIWAEVLKLDKVGIHDNFFHLGGHSLLAIQIVSRVHSTFGIELPLRRIFESPTVAEIATLITPQHAKGASRPALMHILPELEALTDEEAQKVYETRLRR